MTKLGNFSPHYVCFSCFQILTILKRAVLNSFSLFFPWVISFTKMIHLDMNLSQTELFIGLLCFSLAEFSGEYMSLLYQSPQTN